MNYNVALPTNSEGWFMYIAAAVFLIIIIAVVIVLVKSVNERKKTTNIELPDLDKLEREKRKKRMEEAREEYDFKTVEINESEVVSVDDDDIDTSKYITSQTEETSVQEIEDILAGKSGIPTLVKEVNLPTLDDTVSVRDSQSKEESEASDEIYEEKKTAVTRSTKKNGKIELPKI